MIRVGAVVILLALSQGCSKKQDDATIQKNLVGIWSFNPREQMPQEKVDDVAFETPDQVVLQFETPKMEDGVESGPYAYYEHIPKLVNSKDHWTLERGKWYVHQGKVTLDKSPTELTVLSAAPRQLRLNGFPLLPCNDKNCVLLPLTSVPDGATELRQKLEKIEKDGP